jgi:hypothetical protein
MCSFSASTHTVRMKIKVQHSCKHTETQTFTVRGLDFPTYLAWCENCVRHANKHNAEVRADGCETLSGGTFTRCHLRQPGAAEVMACICMTGREWRFLEDGDRTRLKVGVVKFCETILTVEHYQHLLSRPDTLCMDRCEDHHHADHHFKLSLVHSPTSVVVLGCIAHNMRMYYPYTQCLDRGRAPVRCGRKMCGG